MKITRKRTGVTIRCSDSEFEMLDSAMDAYRGLGTSARPLSGNARAAFTRRLKGGDVMRIDIDKRDA